MKVLIVTQYYPPHVGGLEVVAQKQAQSLTAAGHKVTVITCHCANAAAGETREGQVTVRRVRSWNYLDRRFGLPFALPSLGFITELKKAAASADLIQLHDVLYPASWLGYIIASVSRKPLVLVQHVALVDHPRWLVRAVQKLIYRTIGAAIFRAAKKIVVYNRNVKSFLLARGLEEGNVLELRNGVDLTQFQPLHLRNSSQIRRRYGLSTTKPLVLFVGRLVPKKGFNLLLEAADKSFQMVFAGSGEIPSFGAEPDIFFTGPLTQSQLVELYQASDLFILPSYGELFTVAMQEAMASGLPVVINDDPGYASYPIDRRLVSFVSPSAIEIRRTILSLLASARQRREMASYSRRLAEKWFDWDRNFVAFEKLLLTILPEPA